MEKLGLQQEPKEGSGDRGGSSVCKGRVVRETCQASGSGEKQRCRVTRGVHRVLLGSARTTSARISLPSLGRPERSSWGGAGLGS